MKAKDPTLEIVPSKEGTSKFSDLTKFPSNEKDYNELFEHAVDKQPTEARKIMVKHSLITSMKFSDLKFQNAKLMDHMYANKIWIRYNQSDTLQVAALGFIQGVHPRVAHRDGFIYDLQEAIQFKMTETERIKITTLLPPSKSTNTEEGEIIKPDIKLKVISRAIGYGNGEGRIKTEAFEIRVRKDIKEILTRLGNNGGIPTGRYIPYGLVQTVGAEVYKKMLRLQNDYLTNFRLIPLFGICPKALTHQITIDYNEGPPHQTSVQDFILSKSCIHAMETTNRAEDLGKIFLISDAKDISEARNFVDNVLKQLYESGSIPPELKFIQTSTRPGAATHPDPRQTSNHMPQP